MKLKKKTPGNLWQTLVWNTVILAMASLRPSTLSRRSNSRNRNNSTAFAYKEGQKQRASNSNARTFKASNSQSHVHGSCEPQANRTAKNSNGNGDSEHKKPECVKLVTYPIMQVWVWFQIDFCTVLKQKSHDWSFFKIFYCKLLGLNLNVTFIDHIVFYSI